MSSSFGGTVKLTGESEYRKALQNITQGLREVSAQMKLTSTEYDKNDKSAQALTAQSTNLSNQLKLQQDRLTTLKNSYKDMSTQYETNTNKHKSLVDEYNKEKTKLTEIGKELGTTSKEYQTQKDKVDDLAKEVTKSSNIQEQNTKTMSRMRIEIANAQADVNKTTKALDELGNEEDEAGKKARNAEEGFTILKGTLANLASTAITSVINGMKKLGSSLIDIGKQAVNSYAEYEQLVGGVETLFKDSADKVQEYANQAYKTAGISANQYMEQATSFSASLLQGLGGDTAKAAEIADMAITDMADNANKMGTSIEMIQNAYQGFAKQNYTMLDNLKLGYGGTKSEMARLVKESGILGKAGDDLTAKNLDQKVSFDQIIKAINATQKKMGIYGTTSKEAASTIQGSVSSMKASWNNLLTAIADDNKDLKKSVNEFVDSTITASQNLVPRVKKVVEGIKKLINSIVTEVFPKLKKEIPELAPIIDVFKWFIDNRNLVVGAIGAMVGAFAINKIVSFTKGLSDAISSIIKIATTTATATVATTANTTAIAANTTAQVAGTTATGALTAATNLLNAAWKANPVGLVVTGITALVSIIGILSSKTDEATEAQKAQSKALEEAAEKAEEANKAYDDLRQAQQNQVNAGMTELSHYQSLTYELKSLVDENGKVKKGYEERASFITTTLANALGVEIKYVDGIIEGYGNLKNSIDEVIKKKKAQIILDSQETLYKEAINGQTNALRDLSKVETELQAKQEERKSLEAELVKSKEKLQEADRLSFSHGDLLYMQALREVEAIENKIKVHDEDTANLQKNYNEQKDLLSKYAYDIGVYEQNMALAHAGEYENMSNVNWNYVKDFQKAGDAEKAQLQDQIKLTETNLNLLKELKTKSGKDIYDQQIADNEKLLAEQKESLKKYQMYTEDGLNGAKIKWENGLDKILSQITGSNIEFKEDGKGNIQAYADGIKLGEPKSKQEMAKLITNTIKEVSNKNPEAKKAGENFIEGVNKGITNRDKQSSVFSSISRFGNSLLSKLKSSLQEKSPSKATKEMGQYLLEGLGLGMENEENSILKQANSLGKSILGSINGGLAGNLNISAIENIKSSIPNVSNQSLIENENFNIIEAFKTALSQMKIELDDEVAGKFVRKTVEDAIYT